MPAPWPKSGDRRSRQSSCGRPRGRHADGGKAAPFGIDLEQLDAVLDRILPDEAIEFRGLHFYVGTQILDCAVVSRQYREAVNIAEAIALRWRRPMATVNFGGGLGVPYFSDEREFDLERFGLELDLLMTDIRAKPVFAGTKFVIEPGRYLTAEAGIYAVQVTDIKLSRGKKFLIVDGGMNHHLAASGNLGQVIKRNFPIAILNKMGVEPQEKVDVVGPLCTPLDVLARDVDLPPAEVGDIIGVFQSGAYARTASPLGFLSHPSPAEVLVENGRVLLIRRRGTYRDLLADIPCDQY